MDDWTTMFGSMKENGHDFVSMNEMSYDGLESPSLSFSTLLDFSSTYLTSVDVYKQCFDPNICPDETEMKPLDDHCEFFDDRLVQVIEYLNQECIRDSDLLVQLWLPVIRHGKRVLTTENIPFMINSDSTNLLNYREVSINYQFAAEYDSIEMIGLPGRVFLKNFPSCASDLRNIAEDNDPRLIYAKNLNLFGCLNLPVFEPDGGNCLGVIEIVTTSQKVNFRDELGDISRALEAVDLRSSEFLIHPKLKDFGDPYEAVLAEIRDVLRSICETLKLPLAQTWGTRKTQSEEPVVSISVIESASYVFDPKILGFYEACCVQQLAQGEGIAGKALGTNQPCFTDIADFCRADFPLAHEATIFGLNGAVAILLHSTYTGPMDFILEFFLPRDCKGDEQLQLQSSIVSMIQRLSCSLHVINDEEPSSFSVKDANTRDESWISHMIEAQQRGENVVISMGCHKEEPEEEFKMINEFCNNRFTFSDPEKQTYLDWGSKSRSRLSVTKREKSRAKTERNISLQVLQQYFPGSLKDAAKSIGVCPTTLKRICRQHGIMRWPSRKIKKVTHSLKKIQLVIDSVQGAEGIINLESFYTNFPELGSPVTPTPKPNVNDRVNLLKTQATPSNSSSSGSHGSSSSLCYSTQNAFHTEKEKSNGLLPRSENKKLVDDYRSPEANVQKNTSPMSSDQGFLRVKATYGKEKIRFRMLKNWGFADLQGEISRRFNIHEMGVMTLEYMDDDSEWVLLACDADLEECVDLHLTSKNETIKLVVYESCNRSLLPMVHPKDDIHIW